MEPFPPLRVCPRPTRAPACAPAPALLGMHLPTLCGSQIGAGGRTHRGLVACRNTTKGLTDFMLNASISSDDPPILIPHHTETGLTQPSPACRADSSHSARFLSGCTGSLESDCCQSGHSTGARCGAGPSQSVLCRHTGSMLRGALCWFSAVATLKLLIQQRTLQMQCPVWGRELPRQPPAVVTSVFPTDCSRAVCYLRANLRRNSAKHTTLISKPT